VADLSPAGGAKAHASNASVIVTVVLSAVFLHQPLGHARGAAIALTLLGATLLAFSTG